MPKLCSGIESSLLGLLALADAMLRSSGSKRSELALGGEGISCRTADSRIPSQVPLFYALADCLMPAKPLNECPCYLSAIPAPGRSPALDPATPCKDDPALPSGAHVGLKKLHQYSCLCLVKASLLLFSQLLLPLLQILKRARLKWHKTSTLGRLLFPQQPLLL